MRLSRIFPIIGIMMFLFILLNIGIDKIVTELYAVKPLYIGIAIVLLIPRIIIYNIKWDFILKIQGIRLPFSYVLKIYFIGFFYGAITPSWIGTYIRVPYIMNKAHTTLGKSVSNIVIDGIVDILSVLLLIVLGTTLIYSYIPILLPFVVTLCVFLILACVYFMQQQRSEKIFLSLITYLIPEKYRDKIRKHFDAFYSDIPKGKKLLIPIAIGVMSWIVLHTQIYFIAQGLSLNIPYLYFILVYPIVFLIELMPISISGLGTREAALIVLFSFVIFDISKENILILSLIGYFVTIIGPAFLGAILSLIELKKGRGTVGELWSSI